MRFFSPFPTGKNMIEKLQYRFRRTKLNEKAIEDVYDGELYKATCLPGWILVRSP